MDAQSEMTRLALHRSSSLNMRRATVAPPEQSVLSISTSCADAKYGKNVVKGPSAVRAIVCEWLGLANSQKRKRNSKKRKLCSQHAQDAQE